MKTVKTDCLSEVLLYYNNHGLHYHWYFKVYFNIRGLLNVQKRMKYKSSKM